MAKIVSVLFSGFIIGWWLLSAYKMPITACIIHSLFISLSSLYLIGEDRPKNCLFTLLFSLIPGGILTVIIIKIFEIKIESTYKNIKKAENQKVDELYRLDDEEKKTLNLLSI